MKIFLMAFLLFCFVSGANAQKPRVDALPDEVSFRCSCLGSMCEQADVFTLDYKPNTQFFKFEGGEWIFSGYATKQYSKPLKRTYFRIPDGYSIASKTVEMDEDGQISFLEMDQKKFHCERL